MSAAPALQSIRRTAARPPAARSSQPTALRLVAAPPRRRGFQVYVGVCLAVLVGALGTVLWLNTALAAGAFEIREYQLQLSDLEIERESLNEQLVALAEPQALAAKAAELGMVAAPATGYLVLRDGTVIGAAPPDETEGEPGQEASAGAGGEAETTSEAGDE